MARGDEKAPIPSVSNPTKGQLEKTQHNLRGGVVGYWQWGGEEWIPLTKRLYNSGGMPGLKPGGEQAKSSLFSGPIGGVKGPSDDPKKTLRWPSDAIYQETDYVFFQFGRYLPPFSRDADKLRKTRDDALKAEAWKDGIRDSKSLGLLTKNSNTSATYDMYNSSAQNLKPEGSNIMLPMPQDLSNEIQQQWQGKQFTATGRAATAALAGGQFSYASEVVKNIAGNATALQTAFNTTVLNSIPGVGGNIEFNDVSGSTRGIVINPNAELLYDSPEMREIGMIFKLVPRNSDEATTINNIVKRFRSASMPRWGAVTADQLSFLDGDSTVQVGGGTGEAKKSEMNIGGRDNWIQVPDLCKFTFMTGSDTNRKIIQFKPCAISAVEVNYTPDGTYAAYEDGQPAAIELRINFMETKLVFADEVERGF